MSKPLHIVSEIALPILVLMLTLCEQQNKESKRTADISDKAVSPYLNHNDTTRYVGMSSCRSCHQRTHATYTNTGMGRSFDIASREKSSADFRNANVKDGSSGYRYHAFWKEDSLYFHEFRIEKGDTAHSRIEQVNYIIGSGQHTNSHIKNTRGYLTQMPMTFYTQKKMWDLPPGFEQGYNTHFSRKIGLECMSCHNALPDFVIGSENKYRAVPRGIDCERCHGPGSIHVAERTSRPPLDTSKVIDYTIVNPSKLTIERQFDICQRCHLQGNAVLKDEKSFYDFKPGMKLSDFISVFLPKYKHADDEFIMASHADRLKQSPCFIRSLEKSGNAASLRPYKNALTCVTCHNPHVSVQETNKNVFNDACNGCHAPGARSELLCTEPSVAAARTTTAKNFPESIKNCAGCHMPVSGSTDIPHVTVHDHFIRKPLTKTEKKKIKEFVGLFSVNEVAPGKMTRAKAYIQQYAKFEPKPLYLDSAKKLLDDLLPNEKLKALPLIIELHFIKQEFAAILKVVDQNGEDFLLKRYFTKQSYANSHAWSCYHIAEANYYSGRTQNSLIWFAQAVKLAPYNLDFRNKLATVLAANGKQQEAIGEYEFILKENPAYTQAYSNLGFLRLQQGMTAEALRLYNIGESLDPDNEALLLNLAGFYFLKRDRKKAVVYLQRVLKLNPRNEKAKAALQQLSSIP